jgi:hypothetical protein
METFDAGQAFVCTMTRVMHLLLTLLCLITDSTLILSQSSVEEEKYGVRYASDCEGE